MNEQTKQIPVPTTQHSHKLLYTACGLLSGAVVVLVVLIVGMYANQKQHVPSSVQSQVMQPQQPAPQTAQQQLQQSITPVPVTTKQDLTAQQNTLDTTDMTGITSGLDQTAADASQFSQ